MEGCPSAADFPHCPPWRQTDGHKGKFLSILLFLLGFKVLVTFSSLVVTIGTFPELCLGVAKKWGGLTVLQNRVCYRGWNRLEWVMDPAFGSHRKGGIKKILFILVSPPSVNLWPRLPGTGIVVAEYSKKQQPGLDAMISFHKIFIQQRNASFDGEKPSFGWREPFCVRGRLGGREITFDRKAGGQVARKTGSGQADVGEPGSSNGPDENERKWDWKRRYKTLGSGSVLTLEKNVLLQSLPSKKPPQNLIIFGWAKC